MDGSHHPWLGDQVPPFTLLTAVDDATGTVVDALFCEQEDSRSYFLLMQGLIRRCGLPLALYTDRHGVFRHAPGSGLPGMPTQFSRAMEELGVQMIFARSPQGKGRVERAAGTFQDRLVTELRLANAGSILEANRVLEQFLPRFNQRFGVPPQYPEPAFRPLDPELRLEPILCFKHLKGYIVEKIAKLPGGDKSVGSVADFDIRAWSLQTGLRANLSFPHPCNREYVLRQAQDERGIYLGMGPNIH